MSEKKYTIVRVDRDDEDFKCPICPSITQSCCDCKIVETYGDTKEQLVVKVAQILKQQMFLLEVYEDYKEAAKNIVEFLGVIE